MKTTEIKHIKHKPIRVSIIGSAGRGEDAGKITQAVFGGMINKCFDVLVDEWHLDLKSVTLQSGGAACADHVAVQMWLELGPEVLGGLSIFLPCDAKELLYATSTKSDQADYEAQRTRQLHDAFTSMIGKERQDSKWTSLQDLRKAQDIGAQIKSGSGFHQRNALIADCDYMIAFTWHNSDKEPKPKSGTLQTWRLAKRAVKVHIPLESLAITTPKGASSMKDASCIATCTQPHQ